MLIAHEVMESIGLLPECCDLIYWGGRGLEHARGRSGVPAGVRAGRASVRQGRRHGGRHESIAANDLLEPPKSRVPHPSIRGRPRIGLAIFRGMVAGPFGRNAHDVSR